MIYFTIPECAFPSGGINLLHRHVAFLNDAHIPAQRLTPNAQILDTDTIIIPEGMHELCRQLKPHAHTVTIALNSFYPFLGAEPCFGERVITNSPTTLRLFERMRIPSRLFTTAIRPEFQPLPKLHQAVYNPRKTGPALEPFLRVLGAICPEADAFPILPIQNVSDDEYARLVGCSSLFLSLYPYEGWQGWVFECARARTLVLSLDGGQPYMRQHILHATDFIDAAQQLARYIQQPDAEPYEHLRERAYLASLPYTEAQERASLLETYQWVLNG